MRSEIWDPIRIRVSAHCYQLSGTVSEVGVSFKVRLGPPQDMFAPIL
jgi:hypothetical protein